MPLFGDKQLDGKVKSVWGKSEDLPLVIDMMQSFREKKQVEVVCPHYGIGVYPKVLRLFLFYNP